MAKVHLIGNAHLDPAWLWRWQEGFAEIKATFRSALDRMKEFPDFTFTCAGASYYQWVEENDPAMFEEVRRRVAEGRWIIAGGWWLQPDCNIPSGESFARHALYSQLYFKEKFGKTASFGYNVDSFGHNAMLPQLLSKSGMDSYVFMRPEDHEKELPSVFWWESPDGSRVLTNKIRFHYGTGWNADQLSEKFYECAELSEELGLPVMCFYGVGNHGGGPTIPSLRRLEELVAKHGSDYAAYSSPETYFTEIRNSGKELPVVNDDLQHHASGCYSTVSEIKANNRKAECRLTAAEKMMTAAHTALSLEYRGDLMEQAWKDVLFNQFHDIMGGCSIREVYEDAREFHGEALKIGGDLLNAAVQKLSWNIDTMGSPGFYISKDNDWTLWEQINGGAPIIVFNTLSWDVTAAVQVSTLLSGATDEQGNPIPLQRVRASKTDFDNRWDSLFIAAIPALGYRMFRGYTEKQFEEKISPHTLEAGPCSLENDWFKLEIDQNTGYISNLFDKQKKISVFKGCGALPLVMDDYDNDTWAHGETSFRDETGKFAGASVKTIETGPLRATLRVTSFYERSTLQQDFTLYRDRSGVDVSLKLNWQEQHKILKLAFPVNISDSRPVYEIPYGAFARPANGEEEPGQAWVDVSGRLDDGSEYGLALANTTKYSYDCLDNELRLTVVRSAIYSDHFGERDELVEYMDQGVQYMRYLLLPHTGTRQNSGIVRRSRELLNQPITVLETYHKGSLPRENSFLSISGENITGEALKMAEDGDGMILRCVETLGENAEADISLNLLGVKWKAAFGPFEIKTFRIDTGRNIAEVNLLEKEMNSL